MNIMFFIVIAIFAGYMYFGTKLGLVKMATYLVSSIVLLVISFVLAPMISKVAAENPKIYTYVEKKVEAAYDNLKEYSERRKELEDKKETKKETKKKEAGKNFSEDVIKKISKPFVVYTVIRIAVFLGLYMIASIALFLFGAVLSIAEKLPVVSTLNRLGGAGVGALRALITVWILFILLTIFMEKEFAAAGLRQIGESSVLRTLYDNNLLIKVLENFS